MLKTRVITAVILVVCLLSAVFLLPPLWWSLLTLAAILVAAHEWSRLCLFSQGAEFALLLALAVLAAALLFFPPTYAVACYVYSAAALFWFIAVPVWFYTGWKPVPEWLSFATGLVILLAAWLALIDLRQLGIFCLLGAMALVWVADIAAYFAGRNFGRHKLAPAISPGKTWEGVAGGLTAVLLYAVMVISGWQAYVTGAVALPALTWTGLLAFAVVMGGISVVGDLFESAVKRRAGVKDSGVILPGHGGLLDRVDALLPVLPLAALMTMIFARNQYATA